MRERIKGRVERLPNHRPLRYYTVGIHMQGYFLDLFMNEIPSCKGWYKRIKISRYMRYLLMGFIVVAGMLFTAVIIGWCGWFVGIAFYCLAVGFAYMFLIRPYENETTEMERKYLTTSWNGLGIIGKSINIIFISIVALLAIATVLGILAFVISIILKAIFGIELHLHI